MTESSLDLDDSYKTAGESSFSERNPLKIVVLSDSHLERVFKFFSYRELTEIRIVCRWFYFVIGAMMNRKLRSLSKKIKNRTLEEKIGDSCFGSRLRVLRIVEHEIRTVESSCSDYINGNMFYFYGGLILDFVDKILDSLQTDDTVAKAAKLFMLVSRFLKTFDSVTEPFLLRRSYHLPYSWFGKKIVDTLENCGWIGHVVTLEPQQKEPSVKWTGKYVAESVGVLSPPPFVADSSDVVKIELDAILRYVRNAVRWNNILRVIHSDADQRLDKKVHVENDGCHRVISEKLLSFENRERPKNPCKMEFNVSLLCHTIFGPSSHMELFETLSGLDPADSTESIRMKVPEPEDYRLDLTLEITYKTDRQGEEVYKTAIIQICQMENSCYIASDTMLADMTI